LWCDGVHHPQIDPSAGDPPSSHARPALNEQSLCTTGIEEMSPDEADNNATQLFESVSIRPAPGSSFERALRGVCRSPLRPGVLVVECSRSGACWGGRVDGGPEFGAQPVGVRGVQRVGNDDAFDHVGNHGAPRAVPESDRHDGAAASPADRSVNSDEPGRTPESRSHQTASTRLTREQAGNGGEFEGGGGLHTPSIMTKGYRRVAPYRSWIAGPSAPEDRFRRNVGPTILGVGGAGLCETGPTNWIRPGRRRCTPAARNRGVAFRPTASSRSGPRTRRAVRDPRRDAALRPRILRRSRRW
jgi:hypothetical protein